MGKGVVSSFFPQVAESGYQLVYGATANLFTDRHGNYIGFGPEESELAAIADLDTFEVLPWDPRVARVYCDCYDTETGELLDADPRQNLKRVAHEFEEELGLHVPDRHRARDDVAEAAARPGEAPEGVTKPYCYHIHQFEELRPVLLDVVDYGQAMGLDMSYGDHEDAPGQLELNFRFDRAAAHRGQHHHLPPDLRGGRAQARPAARRSCRSRSPACRRTATTTTSRWSTTRATTSSTTRTARRSSPRSARHFLGGMLDHFRALMCVGNPTVNSYCRMWDFGFWAPVYKNWGWQNRTCTVRVASGGRFEYRGVDSSCNPYLTDGGAADAPAWTGSAASSTPARPSRATPTTCSQRARSSSACPDSLGAALDALEADEVVRERDARPPLRRLHALQARRVGALPGGGHRLGARASTWRCCRDLGGRSERVRDRRDHLSQRRRRARRSGAT